jgi:hypothetical protein
MKYEKGSFTVIPNKEALRGLDPVMQCVFFWICAYADDKGQCYPSRSRLADDVGCSVRTIDKALLELCRAEMLVKQTRFVGNENATNLYQILLRGAKSTPPRANSALPPVQILRTELYPILTQSNNDDSLRESSSFQGKEISNSEYTRVEVDEQFGVPREANVKSGSTAPNSPLRAPLLKLQRRFGELCQSAIGTRPVPDKKGLAAIKFALNTGGLNEARLIELFEWWFDQRKPDEELISITRALSARSIEQFKLQN